MSFQPNRIAIVDDVEIDFLSVFVEELDAEPISVPGPLPDIRDAIDIILGLDAGALICDHMLSRGGYAGFTGANLCADLYGYKIPFVLISTFLEQDSDVSIRRWRRWIPTVLDKSRQDPEAIGAAISTCWEEQNGVILPERAPRRVLLQVLRFSDEGDESVADAEIPSWRRNSAVRFPISLIEEQHKGLLADDTWWLADVNIGTDYSRDLFFDRIEPAPEPMDDEFFKQPSHT